MLRSLSAWRKCGLHWKPSRQLKKWYIVINIGLDWRALCLSVSVGECPVFSSCCLKSLYHSGQMGWSDCLRWCGGTYFTGLRIEHRTLLRWSYANKSVWLLSCLGIMTSLLVFLFSCCSEVPAALWSLFHFTKPHSKQLALLSRRKLPPCSCFLTMVRFCSLNVMVAAGDGLQCPRR